MRQVRGSFLQFASKPHLTNIFFQDLTLVNERKAVPHFGASRTDKTSSLNNVNACLIS